MKTGENLKRHPKGARIRRRRLPTLAEAYAINRFLSLPSQGAAGQSRDGDMAPRDEPVTLNLDRPEQGGNMGAGGKPH